MKHFLLLDFGTTSTKSTLVDLDSGIFTAPESYAALDNVAREPKRCEFALDAVAQRFQSICAAYYARTPFAGIVLSSEMHGFAVLDTNDQPLSNYISWKDERSLEKTQGSSAFDEVCDLFGERFKTITGMKARPGFAPMNFVRIARDHNLPQNVKIVDLPGWLCRSSGRATGLAHPTMLAGLALYDVQQGETSDELVEAVRQLSGSTCHLDHAAAAGQISGYWSECGTPVPIYLGIGDHQCSLLGAGLVSADTLSINLGTGAQVSVLNLTQAPDESEIRPYFAASQLHTITHIPGGRALAEYIGFLREVGDPQRDFWQALAAVDAANVCQSDLDFGLGLFPSARGFDGGGRIGGIGEGRFTLDNYLASLLRAFAGQYLDLAHLFDPENHLSHCLLSGGMARRLPLLKQLIADATSYDVQGATDLDESLLGLRSLALVAAGRAENALAAQAIFGRESTTSTQ
jgi:sugar (pentulose or hexulose) kinase